MTEQTPEACSDKSKPKMLFEPSRGKNEECRKCRKCPPAVKARKNQNFHLSPHGIHAGLNLHIAKYIFCPNLFDIFMWLIHIPKE